MCQKTNLTQTGWKNLSGVTLIEVLIALLIMGLVISSLLIMQGHSIRLTQESVWRNQAAILARDLVDRVEIDRIRRGDVTSSNIENCMQDDECQRVTAWAESQIEEITAQASEQLPSGQVVVVPCDRGSGRCVKLAWSDTDLEGCSVPTSMGVSDLTAGSKFVNQSCLMLQF